MQKLELLNENVCNHSLVMENKLVVVVINFKFLQKHYIVYVEKSEKAKKLNLSHYVPQA